MSKTLPFKSVQEIKDLGWAIKSELPKSVKVNQVLEAIAKHYAFQTKHEMYDAASTIQLDNNPEINAQLNKMLDAFKELPETETHRFLFTFTDDKTFEQTNSFSIRLGAEIRTQETFSTKVSGVYVSDFQHSLKVDTKQKAFEITRILNEQAGNIEWLKRCAVFMPETTGIQQGVEMVESPFTGQKLHELLFEHDGGGSVVMRALVLHLYNSDNEFALQDAISSLDNQNWALAIKMIEHYRLYGEEDKQLITLGRNLYAFVNHREAFDAGQNLARKLLKKKGITEQEFDLEIELDTRYWESRYTSPVRSAFETGANSIKSSYIDTHPEWEGTKPEQPCYEPFQAVNKFILEDSDLRFLHKYRITLATILWAIHARPNNAPPAEGRFYFDEEELSIYGDGDQFLSGLNNVQIFEENASFKVFNEGYWDRQEDVVILKTTKEFYSYVKTLPVKANPVYEQYRFNDLVKRYSWL